MYRICPYLELEAVMLWCWLVFVCIHERECSTVGVRLHILFVTLHDVNEQRGYVFGMGRVGY